MNSVRLEAVLNYVPSNIRMESDDLTIMSHALQLYRVLQIPQVYEEKVALMEVKGHKVKIPDDVKNVLVVSYMVNDPTETQCKDLLECVESDESFEYDCTGCKIESTDSETSTENICRHTLNYQLFLDSEYYNKNYTILKYKGNRSGVCKFCYTDMTCEYGFRIDKNGVMWTDFQEGFVCIIYESTLVDDEGNILIIDEPELLMAMAAYAEYMHWKNRRAFKERGANTYIEQEIRRAEGLLRAAKGRIKLKNINTDLLKRYRMSYDDGTLMLRAPELYYSKYYPSFR